MLRIAGVHEYLTKKTRKNGAMFWRLKTENKNIDKYFFKF
jgi:hypothetical protein